MAAPTLTRTGQRMHDALAELAPDDATYDYAYAWFCAARAAMFDLVADIVDRGDGRPGYTVLFDPDECPAAFLPWLAQFVGVTIPPGLDEAAARLRIKETDGFRRGTPAALRGAARQFLVGPGGDGSSATVYLTERAGSAYQLRVATLTSETPDSARVLAALLEQKPAGLTLTYSVITGGDYDTLAGTHADYDELVADFTDYDDMAADPAHT